MTVSVVVCTRDRPDQLIRCLKSLCRLSSSPTEIIVVDNGSKNFSVTDLGYPCRTRFFSQPVPGLSYARNLGAYHAAGDIVGFLDDDAVADLNWWKAVIQRFGDHSVGCVTGRVLPLNEKNQWQKKVVSIGWYPRSEEAAEFGENNYDPITTSAGVGCNFFVRRCFFQKHQFPEFLGAGTPAGGGEDHYFFYLLVQSGWRIVYEPESIVYHEFPSDEAQYNRQLLRNSICRGAYLTRFLFWEKGFRQATLKYGLRRFIDFSTNNSARGTPLIARGIATGPFALLHSLWLARKYHQMALERAVLLAEFEGKSQTS